MKRIYAYALIGMLGTAANAVAADVAVDAGPAQVRVNTDAGHANAADARRILRASEVVGLNVYNNADESLGEINDLVLDPATGNVKYAAVSMGGFLGMGDSLYAVPWSAFKHETKDGDHYVRLNVTKESLEGAEGFDQDKWPNFADTTWREKNDRYYIHGVHETR